MRKLTIEAIWIPLFMVILLFTALACQGDPLDAVYDKQVELRDTMSLYVDQRDDLLEGGSDELIAAIQRYARENAEFWQKNNQSIVEAQAQNLENINRSWNAKDEKFQEVMHEILRLDAQIRDELRDRPEQMMQYTAALSEIYQRQLEQAQPQLEP